MNRRVKGDFIAPENVSIIGLGVYYQTPDGVEHVVRHDLFKPKKTNAGDTLYARMNVKIEE